MNYLQVSERLRGVPTVVVTGPNRSGTTIAATILSKMLHTPVYYEESFGMTDFWAFFRMIDRGTIGVIQAPSMSSVVHLIPPPTRIVFMIRNYVDIMKSQERTAHQSPEDWKERELANYFDRSTQHEQLEPCMIKEFAWIEFQKPVLGPRALQLDYESLSAHPLWVPKERRKNFNLRQIREEPEPSPVEPIIDIGGEGG